jgi:hypothetical protein
VIGLHDGAYHRRDHLAWQLLRVSGSRVPRVEPGRGEIECAGIRPRRSSRVQWLCGAKLSGDARTTTGFAQRRALST